ncbi:acetylornithine aminotransferase [Nitritalea halalkaliphila LW7]|uniref:Acetylornithine aminotransferase n=1 Tax=Nitritalea halalkaliphila LW7 TaxID=1189621 RepID=I5C387_9BACT|nr:aminotransferase class III-fold pyridoxal phosphate-dependent enzyme [Nitritalea halalkaliphila]EIM76289.1 acetylornithine aminotransferase [Nitritalea halalkaliphila LW7]
MKNFDVYPLLPITPVRAAGALLWDAEGQEYLDLYGGHAVISIGHSHPHYVARIQEQVAALGFYSNSVHIPIQEAYAAALGRASGLEDYALFLCNSGAEANENALKLASFATGKAGHIAFTGGFHGRTAGAVVLTDNPGIIAPSNQRADAHILPYGDLEAVERCLQTESIASILIEAIQGVGGIHVASDAFLLGLGRLAKTYGAKLILDEVQAGFGRSGKFFAYQWVEGLEPDLVSIAKGMGNGFPIGGVLVHPDIQAKHGMLGTTFGGNHLACAAGLAVLEVMEEEKLVAQAQSSGDYLLEALSGIPGIQEVRGRGLMIGIDCEQEASKVRSELIHKHRIFTGSAKGKFTIRLLPPLNIKINQLSSFIEAFRNVLGEPAAEMVISK